MDGNAGRGSYSDYASLNDVYGITANLKVYYCQNGKESVIGIAKNEFDKDKIRNLFDKDTAMYNILSNYVNTENDAISTEDVKTINEVNIQGNQINNLNEMYNLVSLKKLVLTDYTGSLAGIENCIQLNYILLENCSIIDYSPIGKLGGKLEKLYFYNTTNAEMEKVCSKENTGIGTYKLNNLKNFGIVGNKMKLDIEGDVIDNSNFVLTNRFDAGSGVSEKSVNTITNVEFLGNLSKETKEAIKTLYLNNNNIISLNGLENFKNVYFLRLDFNSIETLNGIKNMSNLKYLLAYSNELGKNELFLNEDKDADGIDDGKKQESDSLAYINSKLKWIDLRYNKIIWIDYLKNQNELYAMYLDNNSNFVPEDLTYVASIYLSIASSRKSIDDKYNEYLLSSNNLVYKNLTPSDTTKIAYLKDMIQENKNKVLYLNLSGSTISDSDFNSILKNYNNLVELNCTDCPNLTTLDWIEGKTSLKIFCFENTNITGNEVAKLDTYATGIRGFRCNNEEIDLASMQKTISRCGTTATQTGWYGWVACSITSVNLCKKLNTCTQITNLHTNGMVRFPDKSEPLDLTNCVSLTSVYLQDCGYIKLPSNCLDIQRSYIDNATVILDNYKNKEIQRIYLGHIGKDVNALNKGIEILNQLISLNINVKRLELDIRMGWYIDIDLLSYLNQIVIEEIDFSGVEGQENFNFVKSSWKNNLYNLKYIKMCGRTLENLDFLSNNRSLQYLELVGCKIGDITGLNCAGTLKYLNLSKNRIYELSTLSGYSHLGEEYIDVNGDSVQGILNLSENVIADEYKYTDQNIVKNIEILSNLINTNPLLVTLNLSGNKGIINYSLLTNAGWDKATENITRT